MFCGPARGCGGFNGCGRARRRRVNRGFDLAPRKHQLGLPDTLASRGLGNGRATTVEDRNLRSERYGGSSGRPSVVRQSLIAQTDGQVGDPRAFGYPNLGLCRCKADFAGDDVLARGNRGTGDGRPNHCRQWCRRAGLDDASQSGQSDAFRGDLTIGQLQLCIRQARLNPQASQIIACRLAGAGAQGNNPLGFAKARREVLLNANLFRRGGAASIGSSNLCESACNIDPLGADRPTKLTPPEH